MIEEFPLVSIITVCYNSAKTIEQTIQSVLQQTYRNIEYILIDGVSNDGTLDIIKKYEPVFIKEKKTYKYISEPDKGIYDAMNKGVTLAHGKWIGIINSDDFYEQRTIELVNDCFISNPDIDIVHGNLNFIDEAGRCKIETPKEDISFLRTTMIVFHPTIFIKKALYEKYGLFDLKYKLIADWELLLRFYDNKALFFHLNETLSNFRGGGAGSGFKLTHLKERYKIRHKYNKKVSFWLDFKDVLIYIYFRIYFKKSSM
ncbi:glycosyltransferase family 2 protein [Mucilaginibacter sp. OK098]|uniref:glycosyltransferase family 2 protein n=1 Tax=Mucilaginibacter sp. OK098 TaxID=1855297 RepID=UPI00091C48BF|nr:glycosyltransferase family 2 protein [Mucilaginibacter sp. OK098]SHN13281.1 Glycosyltransferase involved in cell wall bisynthesis [Mucilaginibacter sp. OK098]